MGCTVPLLYACLWTNEFYIQSDQNCAWHTADAQPVLSIWFHSSPALACMALSMLRADCALAESVRSPTAGTVLLTMFVPQRPECYFSHGRWPIRNKWMEFTWFSLHFPGYYECSFVKYYSQKTPRGPRLPNLYVGSHTERLWVLSTYLARDHDISTTGLRSKPRALALHPSTIYSRPFNFLSLSFLIWGRETGRSNLQGCREDYERYYTWKY